MPVINLKRRFFLFGAAAVAAAPVVRTHFILPRAPRFHIIAADYQLGRISGAEWVGLWQDELARLAYKESALLAREVDREILDALLGVAKPRLLDRLLRRAS